MEPRCAPEGIGKAHLADQVSDLLGNPWSARSTSRFQPPERLKAAPVPAHHGLGLDDDNQIQHARPQPIEPDEEEPVGPAKPNPLPCGTAHDIELMPQG